MHSASEVRSNADVSGLYHFRLQVVVHVVKCFPIFILRLNPWGWKIYFVGGYLFICMYEHSDIQAKPSPTNWNSTAKTVVYYLNENRSLVIRGVRWHHFLFCLFVACPPQQFVFCPKLHYLSFHCWWNCIITLTLLYSTPFISIQRRRNANGWKLYHLLTESSNNSEYWSDSLDWFLEMGQINEHQQFLFLFPLSLESSSIFSCDPSILLYPVLSDYSLLIERNPKQLDR